MLVDRRYQIFLSSTYEDLRNERQAATQSIISMGNIAAGMELFPASDLTQLELIKKVIDESDYYIVIVGGRYGSIHPELGLSFTEIEYDYAVTQGLPILGFVIDDIGSLLSSKVESEPAQRMQLERFRTKVLGRTCKKFSDPSDLGQKVMMSLMTEIRINPKIGWIRADQARSSEDIARERELIDENAELKNEIEALDRELRDRVVPIPDIDAPYASGTTITSLTVRFQDSEKSNILDRVYLSWDEIFSAIGPSMFGYIVRKYTSNTSSNQPTYPFEPNLKEMIRTKIYDRVAQRTIHLIPHEIDQLMIQFKQLGYIYMAESKKKDGVFRGFQLTELGEHVLTKLCAKQDDRQ